MRVLVFGDSITQGFFDSQGGWVNRLAGEAYAQDSNVVTHTLEEKNFVFNLGVMSNRVSDVIRRLPTETEARTKHGDQSVIVLAVGINDSALVHNRVVVDEQDFVRDYAKLIDIAHDYTDRVVCLGLSAVDEPLIEVWRERRGGKTWANNRVNLFEDCIKQVAIEKSLPFIPIHDAFLQIHQKEMSMITADGIHPNDHGHRFIYDQVRQGFRELLK